MADAALPAVRDVLGFKPPRAFTVEPLPPPPSTPIAVPAR
jgi:hypothetical protein